MRLSDFYIYVQDRSQLNKKIWLYYFIQLLSKNMASKMMLPIQLTKILYKSWQGQISISSQDSQIYGKCLNGPGKVIFKNGNKYEGNFYNGLLNGQGKFTWLNGIVYEGEFTDNRISGKGNYRWPDGSTYQGYVKDGLRHGVGKYSIDEATYDGEWYEGKKNGKGKIVFKSGSIFQGDFQHDFKDGLGKMYYYPSGNFFEGQWKRDVKQGHGTMNWCDIRQKYVGEWKNNHQQGWGVHVWLQSKGEGKYMRNRYQGNWKTGVRQGFGVFYYANGSKYQGYWKDNMKEGYAFYTNQNGKTSLIMFCKDRMIKGNRPNTLQGQNTKKVPNKKQVEPNFFSLCLSIDHLYYPYHPNLENLFNFLLRNNTQLKIWYKGASIFYQQPSQYSFCLNLEGTWKMIRSLKVLGDFSLANFDRGLINLQPDIEHILKVIEQHSEDSVNYEDLYYKSIGAKIQAGNPGQKKLPFLNEKVHNRQKNILFREFVHLLVWLAFNLEPNIEKPQKSLQKLLVKITPFLDSISKSVKSSGNDNISENKSSISKPDKNITPFYKNTNTDLFNYLNKNIQSGILAKEDSTIKLKDIIGYGRISGIIGQAQYSLLQKIIQKYFDSEVLNRQKSSNWQSSTLPAKILNVMNYELIDFQFIEIIYILFIKKLPNHKETQENKQKYQEIVNQMKSSKDAHEKIRQESKQFLNQKLYIQSDKNSQKLKLKKNREIMQAKRAKKQEKQKQKQRQQMEINMMAAEDINIKDVDFEEEESQFEI